ncbi:MAG: FumA C-terminus/TtdB family hydratase beta subunit [Acutalibacteraceae bacterium]|nr:FumA C-terminus/TtdB family hydratase beta subunit [Acutalibacteraceae bacterium]
MAEYNININQIKEYSSVLRAGDRVLLSGTVYTSRDAAHKRIFELLDNGGKLPYDLNGACIYFAGPTPTPDGMQIGSCGPTTSGRMDVYSPRLLDLGLAAMIGKGERNKAVCDAIVRNKAVYFCAIGGAGALYAKCIKKCEEIAFKDLGCESVKRLELEDFPVIVGIDSIGGNLFK